MMNNANGYNTTSPNSSPPSWSNPNLQDAPVEELHTKPQLNETGDDFLSKPFGTLDEPVMETIMRDARSVATKLKTVLLPLDNTVRH